MAATTGNSNKILKLIHDKVVNPKVSGDDLAQVYDEWAETYEKVLYTCTIIY